MNTSQIHRLVLFPTDSNSALAAWAPLIEALQTERFLAGRWETNTGIHYLAGDCFLDYVTFMGCSPHIAFEPPPDGSWNFCHVEFSEIYPRAQFRCASHHVYARCPHCRKRIAHWGEAISKWHIDPNVTTFGCDKCQEQVSVYQLGWRHTAAFGRMFLDIYSIYPHEGIPTDQLLRLLEQATGNEWGYFYTDR